MDAINDLDTVPKVSLDLAGRQYHPGFVGLVNFGANDYSNVIIQSLAHIRLLRDDLLANYDRFRSMDLTSVLSLLVRKMWSSHLFKCHVSAHELLEYVASRSEKKFSIQESGQPKDFLIWILNHLNREFSSELHSNIIAKIFQGKLRLESKKETKFWLLPLSLPSATLFRDSMATDIPQIDLEELISAKNVEFLRLPKVLLLSINRIDNERKLAGVSNSDLNPTVVRFNPDKLVVGGKNYRLIGNILYDTETSTDAAKDEIHYKVQLLDESRREWVEMRDLRCRVVERDLLFLGHSCLQVWTTYSPHQRVK
ncbi:DEKNAAC101901 [Brettanomyces naardenensis]|uniref:DEKNAAC101901 n=1 Tax=Brettanomyces naardenensis TaxID=13370 RepID=A0A448YJC6_BRENA|nr:DEKNAAC101901 [Brettanomyces naardenensis]